MRGLDLSALLVSSAIVCVMATPAAAQTKSFDVPAQSAQSAVQQLGRQADVQIIAARKVTAGKQTNAVRGDMTVEQALAQMFSGTGLVAKRTGAGTWTVVPLATAGAASGSAGASQGQAVLVGSVRDHKTGAALKGARVEVVETGDVGSTGDLGDFRFARLPTGDVTLRVSYLGFPEQTETVSVVGGLTNRADVYLGSGVTTEIVVIGQVSARAQALNQERTAENSTTVISGDLLGNFNGTTVSDALRRAPGVAFVQDDRTGDGTNIIVRGLSPDYNQVKLNGVALPEVTGKGRAPNLNNLLADSVSEIKISKTLLPSQESTGTGGLVEIETKSPLDRPKRYFNVSLDGTKRPKGFGHEYSASGTASLRFGADGNFGISASLQYRDQDITSYYYNINGIFGPYLPLLSNGEPASQNTIDPRTPFPFFDGADYFVSGVSVGQLNTKAKTRSATFSAEWQVSDATNLRLDYVRSRQTNSTTTNTYGIESRQATYRLQAVPELGGAQRYVYSVRTPQVIPTLFVYDSPNQKTGTDSVSFRGESGLDRLTLKYAAGYSKGKLSLPLTSTLYLQDRRLFLTANDILPEATDPRTGTYVTFYGPRRGRGIPAPLFTSDVFDRLATSPLPYLGSYSALIDESGQSQNWTGDLSAKYDFGPGLLKYVEAGFSYRRSSFSTDLPSSSYYSPVYDAQGDPVPLEQVGIEFQNLPFSTQDGTRIYRLPTRASVSNFIANLAQYAADGFLTESLSSPEAFFDDTGTREEQLIGYVQARADIGKLEIIGGVRIERNNVRASVVNGVYVIDELGVPDQAFYDATRKIVESRASGTTYLPRFLANYRPREDMVIRAGYYSTVARPQVSQLNSDRFIYYSAVRENGPTGTQPLLSITSGNPALKPARTHNFDVSAEWYDGQVGVIKLSAFYKRINNLLENNSVGGSDALGDFELPDHPLLNNLPADTLVQYTYPVNNPKPATIWGIEAAVERRLTFLPGALSGLGIYANYVYSDSKKTQPLSYYGPVFGPDGSIINYADQPYIRVVPFDQSPRHSGTLGLTYSKYGLDASLFYTAQARRQSGVGNFGMDFYAEAVSSLDFKATYQLRLAGSDVRLSVEGLNLLKDKSDANTDNSIGGVNGLPKYYTSGNFLGGRKFALGLSATF